VRLGPWQINFTVNEAKFVDVDDLVWKYLQCFTLIGLVGLMAALKVFKFLAISKKMNTLWLTLSRAAPDLFTFLVGCVPFPRVPCVSVCRPLATCSVARDDVRSASCARAIAAS
jgi:hypothetical protein